MPNGAKPDLKTIIDNGTLGRESSSEYLERLDLLDNVVRECIFISKSFGHIASPTGKHFYASIIFTALLTRSVSLLCLAPLSSWADKKIEHWDYASLAGIVRTIIELRIAFYYLCVEQCSEDEWNCRWNLFNLHDCITRKRLFEAKEGYSEQIAEFERQADELRDRLRSNEYFRALDTKRHKKLLHGQTAYLFSLEEIAERSGLAIATFRWLYIMFSSHVHGLPMSYYRMGGDNEERGRGLPSPIEDNYSALCLSLAATLLVQTRDEMESLFEGLGKIDELSASEAEIAPPTGEALAVGEMIEINVTDEIRISTKRTGEDSVEFVYFYRVTDQVVLERSDSDSVGAGLKWFDPLFWNVLVDGRPVTERMLNDLEGKRYAFKVDHNDRTIGIITEA